MSYLSKTEILVTGLYLSVALWYFATLFKDFQEETNLSPEQMKYSWRVIIIAATLWLIAVPISYLEKRLFSEKEIRHPC